MILKTTKPRKSGMSMTEQRTVATMSGPSVDEGKATMMVGTPSIQMTWADKKTIDESDEEDSWEQDASPSPMADADDSWDYEQDLARDQEEQKKKQQEKNQREEEEQAEKQKKQQKKQVLQSQKQINIPEASPYAWVSGFLRMHTKDIKKFPQIYQASIFAICTAHAEALDRASGKTQIDAMEDGAFAAGVNSERRFVESFNRRMGKILNSEKLIGDLKNLLAPKATPKVFIQPQTRERHWARPREVWPKAEPVWPKAVEQKVEHTSHNDTSHNDTSHPGQMLQTLTPDKLKKTKVCNSIVKNCPCRHKFCNFAHTKEEWNPIQCPWGAGCRCKNTRCQHLHPGETKEDVLAKLNMSQRALVCFTTPRVAPVSPPVSAPVSITAKMSSDEKRSVYQKQKAQLEAMKSVNHPPIPTKVWQPRQQQPRQQQPRQQQPRQQQPRQQQPQRTPDLEQKLRSLIQEHGMDQVKGVLMNM